MFALLSLLNTFIGVIFLNHAIHLEKTLLVKWELVDKGERSALRLDYAGAGNGKTPALCLFRDLFSDNEWQDLTACEF